MKEKLLDGGNVKYKARFVINGNENKHSPLLSSYAPIVHSSTVKLFFVIFAEENLELYGIDCVTVFLQTKVPNGTNTYTKRCYGLTDDHLPRKFKLESNWYGLPEAAKAFRSLGFKPTITDPCVYRLNDPHSDGYILVMRHVNDSPFATNNSYFCL